MGIIWNHQSDLPIRRLEWNSDKSPYPCNINQVDHENSRRFIAWSSHLHLHHISHTLGTPQVLITIVIHTSETGRTKTIWIAFNTVVHEIQKFRQYWTIIMPPIIMLCTFERRHITIYVIHVIKIESVRPSGPGTVLCFLSLHQFTSASTKDITLQYKATNSQFWTSTCPQKLKHWSTQICWTIQQIRMPLPNEAKKISSHCKVEYNLWLDFRSYVAQCISNPRAYY